MKSSECCVLFQPPSQFGARSFRTLDGGFDALLALMNDLRYDDLGREQMLPETLKPLRGDSSAKVLTLATAKVGIQPV